MNFLETFRLLLAAASPSGYEAPEAEVIRRLAAPYCDKIKTDSMGNLICRKKRSGKKLMLAAHMDVIGFMVSRFETWAATAPPGFQAKRSGSPAASGVCSLSGPRPSSARKRPGKPK